MISEKNLFSNYFFKAIPNKHRSWNVRDMAMQLSRSYSVYKGIQIYQSDYTSTIFIYDLKLAIKKIIKSSWLL